MWNVKEECKCRETAEERAAYVDEFVRASRETQVEGYRLGVRV